MRIAVLEDDKNELAELLLALKEGWNPIGTVECYNSGEQLLLSAIANNFDIAFLDIYMKNESGIDIAKKLLEISPNAEIVFTTTSLDHAIKAFELIALHYLVKPVTKEMIKDLLQRYNAKIKKKRPVILVKVGRNHQLLFLDQITYLQSNNHMTIINLLGSKSISVYSKISDLEKELDECFVRIQRGIIVNMSFIDRMDSKECVLQNGEKIMLSRKEKRIIRKIYENYIFKCLEQQENKYD